MQIFKSINMDLIKEKLKLEEDNLLILDDDDPSSSFKQKTSSFETPMPPKEQEKM